MFGVSVTEKKCGICADESVSMFQITKNHSQSPGTILNCFSGMGQALNDERQWLAVPLNTTGEHGKSDSFINNKTCRMCVCIRHTFALLSTVHNYHYHNML